MTSQLILHPSTHEQLDRFAAAPAHAVLLVGPDGIGKTAIAEELVAAALGASLHNHPYVLRIAATGSSISIEAIRELQQFLRLKTTGRQSLRRAVLIEHAQALTVEAQNAFLKLLEEPPADTLLVLTADTPRALLPTILSRLQAITVHAPAEEQLHPLLNSSGKDETTQRQAYFLSGGLPGLLAALLSGDATHPLLQGVVIAKDILQKTPFDRLTLVDSLSKQKPEAQNILAALLRIAESGLLSATAKQDKARLAQWHRIRKAVITARQALDASVNAKLALTNCFLQL